MRFIVEDEDGERDEYRTLDGLLMDIAERAGPFRGEDPTTARDCHVVVNYGGIGETMRTLPANTAAAREARRRP